jgi:hypothetical protein
MRVLTTCSISWGILFVSKLILCIIFTKGVLTMKKAKGLLINIAELMKYNYGKTSERSLEISINQSPIIETIIKILNAIGLWCIRGCEIKATKVGYWLTTTEDPHESLQDNGNIINI